MNPQTNMTDMNSFGGYNISTLRENRRDGTLGIAYCPICDRAEESHDQGAAGEQAIIISIGKVRIHMHLVHRVQHVAAASGSAGTDVA